MAPNLLTVSEFSATGLGKSSPDEDVSKHTPYVEFQIGSETHKTKGIKKAFSEVTWEGESFQFDADAGTTVTVSVWHKRHVLSDVAIGKGQITTAELGENGPVEVKLSEPKTGAPAGILKFSISGNAARPYPASASVKGASGDAPPVGSTSPTGTAGFAGTGAEAHDETGVKTGRAYPQSEAAQGGNSSAATGPEAAAVGAGAAAAASAGAVLGGAASKDGAGTDTSTPASAVGPQGTKGQTYTDTAKEKAASAADFTAAKLQDLKVGLVGEDGAAKAEGKAPGGAAVSTEQPATYMDKAKEGAAYVITKAQDALAYTKDRVVGTAPGQGSADPGAPTTTATKDVPILTGQGPEGTGASTDPAAKAS